MSNNGCPVTVLWDIENCPVPPETSGMTVVAALRSFALRHGFLKTVSAIGPLQSIPDEVRAQLQNSGVSLHDVPSVKPGSTDIAILVELLKLVVDNRPPHTIVLISGDRDFSNVLNVLVFRRYEVVLIHLPQASEVLRSAANKAYEWGWFLQTHLKDNGQQASTSTQPPTQSDGPSENWQSSPHISPQPSMRIPPAEQSGQVAGAAPNPHLTVPVLSTSREMRDSRDYAYDQQGGREPMMPHSPLPQMPPHRDPALGRGDVRDSREAHSPYDRSPRDRHPDADPLPSPRDYHKHNGHVDAGTHHAGLGRAESPHESVRGHPMGVADSSHHLRPDRIPQELRYSQEHQLPPPPPPAYHLEHHPYDYAHPHDHPPHFEHAAHLHDRPRSLSSAAMLAGPPYGSVPPPMGMLQYPPPPPPPGLMAPMMPIKPATRDFRPLIEAIRALQKSTAASITGVPSPHPDTIPILLTQLGSSRVPYLALGYKKLKDYIMDAAATGIVQIGGISPKEWVSIVPQLPPRPPPMPPAMTMKKDTGGLTLDTLVNVLEILKKEGFKPTEWAIFGCLKRYVTSHHPKKPIFISEAMLNSLINAAAATPGFEVIGSKGNRVVYGPSGRFAGCDPNQPNDTYGPAFWINFRTFLRQVHPVSKKGRYAFAQYLKKKGTTELKAMCMGQLAEVVQLAQLDKHKLLVCKDSFITTVGAENTDPRSSGAQSESMAEAEQAVQYLAKALEGLRHEQFKPLEAMVRTRLRQLWAAAADEQNRDKVSLTQAKWEEILRIAVQKHQYIVQGAPPDRVIYPPQGLFPGIDPNEPQTEFATSIWAALIAFLRHVHPTSIAGRYNFAMFLHNDGPTELRELPLAQVCELVQLAQRRGLLAFAKGLISTRALDNVSPKPSPLLQVHHALHQQQPQQMMPQAQMQQDLQRQQELLQMQDLQRQQELDQRQRSHLQQSQQHEQRSPLVPPPSQQQQQHQQPPTAAAARKLPDDADAVESEPKVGPSIPSGAPPPGSGVDSRFRDDDGHFESFFGPRSEVQDFEFPEQPLSFSMHDVDDVPDEEDDETFSGGEYNTGGFQHSTSPQLDGRSTFDRHGSLNNSYRSAPSLNASSSSGGGLVLQPVTFRWPYGGNNVQLVGSFSDWSNPVMLREEVDEGAFMHYPRIFAVDLLLHPGVYQYKFLVDNRWMCDDSKPKVVDSVGNSNNWIEVLPLMVPNNR